MRSLPQVKLTISFGIAALLLLVLILKPLQQPTAFIDLSPIDDVHVSDIIVASSHETGSLSDNTASERESGAESVNKSEQYLKPDRDAAVQAYDNRSSPGARQPSAWQPDWYTTKDDLPTMMDKRKQKIMQR